MHRKQAGAAGGHGSWSRALLAAGLFGILVAAWVYSALPVTVPAPAAVEAPATTRPTELTEAAPAPSAVPPPTWSRPVEAAAASREYPTDPAQLVRVLGPLQREVSEGLAALDRDAGCAWGEMFATLTLVSDEGAVDIEAIELHRRPPAPDPDAPDHDPSAFAVREVEDPAAAACLQKALADRTIAAPAARPGRRWQTSYAPGGQP